MSEGTLVKPKEGVSKMKEVSGVTGQVGGGKEALKGGVYRHPENGQEIIALDDPITGDAQARGYVRAGFEWVRDVKDGDIKIVGLTSEDFASQPERKTEADSEELKGLRARLAVLEASADKSKDDDAKADTATEVSQKRAQEAAEQKTEERGTDNSGDVAAHGGVNAPVTPEQRNEKEDSHTSKKGAK